MLLTPGPCLIEQLIILDRHQGLGKGLVGERGDGKLFHESPHDMVKVDTVLL